MDRLAYLSFLDRELSRRGGFIGSYCLMVNHLHLLLQMAQTSLGEIFRTVHMKYAKYFNNKRDTVGHVFQGRPGMKIVLDNSYCRQLVGYIHQNPTEAGIVDQVTDYKWSSWKWISGLSGPGLESVRLPPGFQSVDRKQLFNEVIEEEVQLDGKQHYWGTQEEWSDLERRRPGRDATAYREKRGRKSKMKIAEKVVTNTCISIDDLQSRSQKKKTVKFRREAMSRMYEEGWGVSEIARWFNRTPGAVNHAYNKWCEFQ
ncbi:MAG: hypothetical protein ABEJ65_08850 [bacterium]